MLNAPQDSMNALTPYKNDLTKIFKLIKNFCTSIYSFLDYPKSNLSIIYNYTFEEKNDNGAKWYEKISIIKKVIDIISNYDFSRIFEPESSNFSILINSSVNCISENKMSYIESITSITSILSKTFSFVLYKSQYQKILQFLDTEHISIQKNLDNNYALCRICEENVDMYQLDSHRSTCVLAFKKELKVTKLDKRIIRLRNEIIRLISNYKQNNIRENSKILYASMSDVIGVLDQIIENVIKNYEDLNNIVSYLINLRLPIEHQNADKFRKKAIEFIFNRFHIATSNAWDFKCTKLKLHNSVSINDFMFIKKISDGAFSNVYLSKKISTGDLYAIKVISIKSIKQNNLIRNVLNEKKILLKTQDEYIVTFYHSIAGENNIYLVMEFLQGGDIYSLLNTVGSLNEKQACLYAVQIIMALEGLRSKGIIHRDIKPNNILIAADGRLKLIDFGLSVFCSQQDNVVKDHKHIIGTPDYIAPEIIRSDAYTYSVDYWSLGVVIFEMVTGCPPFNSVTKESIFSNIVACNVDWSLLDDCSDELKDLLKRLLELNPEKRLGHNSIDEIKNHPWFKDINWENIETFEPVFKPKLSDELSTEYFESFHSSGHNIIEKDILDDIEQANQTKFETNNVLSSWNLE